MSALTFNLNEQYFDAIKSGEKTEEYREVKDFWTKRIEKKGLTKVVVCLAYPPKGDHSKRIEFPFRGFVKKWITHPHFGPGPRYVYAIKLEK